MAPSDDAKQKKYTAELERALRAFEYTSEWADLIAALGKLAKVRFGHTLAVME